MDKPRGRAFQPGNTFGQGRPKGSRNKVKFPGQRLLEEDGENLVRKCILLAMQGSLSAMRICMERLSPARREACIQMSLPRIRTVQDVAQAAEKVTQAVGHGDLTPSQGQTMMHILEGRSHVIETVEFARRLDELERVMAVEGRPSPGKDGSQPG
jgi:hypothetical protein